MVKSGLEFILKLTEPLQRYLLSCQANSAILGRYFCTGQQQLWKGSVNFKVNSRPLFTIIYKLKNGNFMTRDFSPLIERVLTGVDRSKLLKICGLHYWYVRVTLKFWTLESRKASVGIWIQGTKGQLISKANSKLCIWTKNQRNYFCISVLASKSDQIKKI